MADFWDVWKGLAAQIKELRDKQGLPEPKTVTSPYDLDPPTGLWRLNRLESNTPKLRNGALVSQSGDYSPLNKDVVQNGTISLATSSIALDGSNATVVSNSGFAYSYTDTTITIYWDGTNGSTVMVQKRSDRTRQVVAPGSITITGLTPSTAHYGLPFWTPSNKCTIGWVKGTVGSPGILFTANTDSDALQQQYYQEREPLSNGFIGPMTTAAGGSPGGGGGDPGGGCPMLGTAIEGLDGAEVKTTNYKWHDWWHIETAFGGVNVVPEHPFFDQDGFRKQAKDFEIGQFITHRSGIAKVTDSYGFLRACTKVDVKVPRNGLYWANGYLSHNNKVLPL